MRNKALAANRRARLGKRLVVALATILLAAAALAFITPIALTVTNSFMNKTEIAANYGKVFESISSGSGTYISEKVNLKIIPDRVSFSQYISVLIKNSAYLIKFWNSVMLVLPIVVFQIVFALGASYGFARYRGRFRELVFFGYIVLMLMPYQVTLVPNYIIADKLGILNTRWSVILPGIFAPFSVFVLTKAMRRIPSAVIEAAKLDGAGEWRIFTRIAIPMSRAAIYSVAMLVFIDYWNMVEQPLILIKNQELHPLSVFLSQINSGDVGIAFAVATIYMVIPLLLFLYSEDYLIDGISYSGAIKG